MLLFSKALRMAMAKRSATETTFNLSILFFYWNSITNYQFFQTHYFAIFS